MQPRAAYHAAEACRVCCSGALRSTAVTFQTSSCSHLCHTLIVHCWKISTHADDVATRPCELCSGFPCRLTPNAFRNESMTMQARITAMKEQNWVESDEFVKANITAISPELKDLLDKIFIADEFKRITMQVQLMVAIVGHDPSLPRSSMSSNWLNLMVCRQRCN